MKPQAAPRGGSATAPNRKWIADFTYVWTADGWLYVAAVVDETQALDDRIFEPYGVRKTGWISLSGCQPNRVRLTAKPRFDYTTLACLRSAISAVLKPNSASTSSVCSPNSGGRAAILLGVRDSVTG